MPQKVFINDSVYKVSAIGIFDVAKRCFPNGFLGLLEGLGPPQSAAAGLGEGGGGFL